jgi:hypothetical protein
MTIPATFVPSAPMTIPAIYVFVRFTPILGDGKQVVDNTASGGGTSLPCAQSVLSMYERRQSGGITLLPNPTDTEGG